MGTTTNAYIAWGVALEEGAELPWDDMDDPEAWWREVSEYEPLHEPWADDGDYAEGYSKGDPRISEQFAHEREWLVANPIPFELENTCSGDYPMWFLAAPGSILEARRGCPEKIDPARIAADDEAFDRLLRFCGEHDIDYNPNEAGWHLFSYWG